jgi:hypothetical protein
MPDARLLVPRVRRRARASRMTTGSFASKTHRRDSDASRPRERDALATLCDPAIIAMSPLASTLSGFERIGEQDFAQSWLVRFA